MASAVWAEAINEKPQESIWAYVPPAWKGNSLTNFSGSVEVGDQQSDGTTSSQGASGALVLKYEPGVYEIIQTISFNYLNTTPAGTNAESTTVKNQIKAYTGVDYYFGYRIWGFVLNEYERNLPEHMKLKMRTGAGIKYDILRNPFWKLNIGAAFLNREQKSTEDLTLHDEVMSYRLLFKIKSNTVTYSLVGFYIPSVSNGSYEWSADTSLTFDLTSVIALKVGWEYDYNSQPLAASVAKWDRQYYTRVQLKF